MATEGHPVELSCRVLGVSVSGYFAWQARPPSPRAIRHAWLTDVIAAVHASSRETYGARRVHAELTLGRGITVGHNAVELLMRRAGIQGLSGRPRFRRVPHVATATDLVNRQFSRNLLIPMNPDAHAENGCPPGPGHSACAYPDVLAHRPPRMPSKVAPDNSWNRRHTVEPEGREPNRTRWARKCLMSRKLSRPPANTTAIWMSTFPRSCSGARSPRSGTAVESE